MAQQETFRIYLQNEYVRRIEKNPSYSLRAFAKALNVSHGALSQIISGRRPLTKRMMLKLGGSLDLGPQQLAEITHVADSEAPLNPAYVQMAQDKFQVVADWYHFAILELTTIQGFRSDTKWVAASLGLPVLQAQAAIDRLFRLGLITLNKNGGWVDSSSEFLSTGDTKYSTQARRKLQKQLFIKAVRAIEEFPYGERYHSGITMSVSAEKIPEAIEVIKEFRRRLRQLLGPENTKRDRVYHLAVALFPLNYEKNKQEKQK